MSTTPQLQDGEIVVYEGPITEQKNRKNPQAGNGLVTNQRCELNWSGGSFNADKSEIIKVEEEKAPIAYITWPNIVVHHKNGSSVTVSKHPRLENALYALADMPFEAKQLAKPELADVQNVTAWIVAVLPIVLLYVCTFFFASMILTPLMRVLPMSISLSFLGRLFYAACVGGVWLYLIVKTLQLDLLTLKSQGYNIEELGLEKTEGFYAYLFKRAKVFGHSKVYPIVWCIAFSWGAFVIALPLFSPETMLSILRS